MLLHLGVAIRILPRKAGPNEAIAKGILVIQEQPSTNRRATPQPKLVC
jgi:hypothetical protein